MKLKEAVRMVTEAAKKCEATKGDRCIVVLDRGFIFAGNLTQDEEWYTLTNVVNVRKWSKSGFGGLVLSAESAGAVLDNCGDIRFKKNALIFIAPVDESWDNGI